jgi:hypothetical protein
MNSHRLALCRDVTVGIQWCVASTPCGGCEPTSRDRPRRKPGYEAPICRRSCAVWPTAKSAIPDVEIVAELYAHRDEYPAYELTLAT